MLLAFGLQDGRDDRSAWEDDSTARARPLCLGWHLLDAVGLRAMAEGEGSWSVLVLLEAVVVRLAADQVGVGGLL